MNDTVPSTVIGGDETRAIVKGLSEEQLEDLLVEQLQEMVDHGAFLGDVKIMPDTHPGSGAVIGFTMPLDHSGPLRVCPNTVGSDIGCGMHAFRLASSLDTTTDDRLSTIDERIRDTIPMGRSVHSRNDYHMGDDFPWELCTDRWEQTKGRLELQDPDWFEGYGLDEYFKPLCERIEYDPMRAINSVGTLGGGNHFIELGEDADGDYWFVIHSGSRGIGLSIATYWQDQATMQRTNEWIRRELDDALEPYVVPDMDDPELTEWFQGGKGKSYIDSEAIRQATASNYLIGYLHDCVRDAHPDKRDANEALDYLQGQSVAGYLVDMVFAQTYAETNRQVMRTRILDVLDLDADRTIDSPHNLIAWDDLVLRKGATCASEGESFVLPFNMAAGTLICTGRGNDDWNNSAPHGAGRVMSRTQAFDEIEMEAFEQTMDGIYSSSVTPDTLDEAPQAYKDAFVIENALGPTAEIETHIEPVLNIKALE